MSNCNLRHGEIVKGILLINAFDIEILLAELEKHQNASAMRVAVVELAGPVDTPRTDLLFSTLIGGYPVPIVACAKGLIGGWALDVVLGAHLCFAAESCRFDLSGSPGRLAGNAPKGFEPDKNVLSAWEMLELGEINGLDRQSKMMEQAKMAALRISEMAPLAVKACLKAVRESEKSTLTDGLAMEAALFAELFESQDMRRGTAAFLEKTVPVFEGN